MTLRVFFLMLFFALPGEINLQAQGNEAHAKAAPETASLNLLRLDRWMAPGITVGAESSLFQTLNYHVGYAQATIPLFGKLEPEAPPVLEGTHKPILHQCFADLGVRLGTPFSSALGSLSFLEVQAGLSGIRYLGNRGFLLWLWQGRFAESLGFFGHDAALPRVGLRVHSGLGYARLQKPELLWHTGLYMAYDDGLWLPVPWIGLHWRPSSGSSLQMLLPQGLAYSHRFGQSPFTGTHSWELGAEMRLHMDRYGGYFPSPFGIDVDSRINFHLIEARTGVWVGHRFANSRLWLQFHAGWIPYRWGFSSAAPGSFVDDAGTGVLVEASDVQTQWTWDMLDAVRIDGRRDSSRPYFELRFVADLGKDWLGLDLGRVLMP